MPTCTASNFSNLTVSYCAQKPRKTLKNDLLFSLAKDPYIFFPSLIFVGQHFALIGLITITHLTAFVVSRIIPRQIIKPMFEARLSVKRNILRYECSERAIPDIIKHQNVAGSSSGCY